MGFRNESTKVNEELVSGERGGQDGNPGWDSVDGAAGRLRAGERQSAGAECGKRDKGGEQKLTTRRCCDLLWQRWR